MTEPDPFFERYILGAFPEPTPEPIRFRSHLSGLFPEPVDIVIPGPFPEADVGRLIFGLDHRPWRLLRVALLRRSPWGAYDRTPEVLAEVAAVLPPDEARIVLQAGEPSGCVA